MKTGAIVICFLIFNLSVLAQINVICESKEDPSLQPGQIASISINVEDASGLYGFEMFLKYDPDILEFSECLPGELADNYTVELN
jgi:hypothetical protein